MKPLSFVLSVSVIAFALTQEAHAGFIVMGTFTGGTAPNDTPGAGDSLGGGNLTDIFGAAAEWWREIIGDNHTLKINFSWANLTGTGGNASETSYYVSEEPCGDGDSNNRG